MVRQQSSAVRPGSDGSVRLSDRTILLDRRQFLQLAAAAGIVAAASAAGFRNALAQDAGSPSDVADVVTAMAAALGHDLEDIFRFVQEQIRFEPYGGILRGANGTLVARAGNSADQALLLAELLKASSVPVRFVMGSLDDAAVETLMARTVVDAETARTQTLQSLLSDEDVATGVEWSVSGDASPEELSELLDLGGLRQALEQDRLALGPRAARHATDSIDTITAALAAAGIELPSSVSAMPPLEQSAHVWVQADDGSAWLDLDPSFSALLPGEAAAEPVETFESLPDELRHRVAFTVIAETFAGGALAEGPILEASAFADELAYLGLVFAHARAEDLGEVDLIGSGLSEGTHYNAVLLSGPVVVVGQRSISIGGGGGAIADAFGGGGGEGLVEGETSAEWLEVAVTSPGAEPMVARRPIFDRVGTAMRDSGVVDPYAIPAAEFVDLADGAGAQYLPTRAVRAFSVSGATPNVKMLVQELGLDEVSGVSIVTGAFDAARALLGAEVAGSLGSLGFPDAPAVTSLVGEPTATGFTLGLDVWHRAFGTLGLAGLPPTVPPAMLAGVIPYAVERTIMETDPASASQPAATQLHVGAVFEAAVAQGVPTRLLAGGLPAGSPYDPESGALMQRALDAGLVVIVPERAIDLGGRPRLGWWLVDPVSGATVDQMDDGRGNSQAEWSADTVITSSGAITGSTTLGGVLLSVAPYAMGALSALGLVSALAAYIYRLQQRVDRLEFELARPYRGAPRRFRDESDEED